MGTCGGKEIVKQRNIAFKKRVMWRKRNSKTKKYCFQKKSCGGKEIVKQRKWAHKKENKYCLNKEEKWTHFEENKYFF